MNAGPPVISGWDLAASDSSGQNYCGSASPTSVPRARRRELSYFRLLYLDAVSRRGTIQAREHQCVAFSKDASVRFPSRYAQQPIYLLSYLTPGRFNLCTLM